jgi:hypothetical protein
MLQMIGEAGSVGVLYGIQSGQTITLEDFRALDGNDNARSVREILALPLRDRSLYGLTPAGWYRIADQGTLALTPADQEFSRAHFPLAFQLTLLLGAAGDGRRKAAFFVRTPDGSVTPGEDAAHFTFPLLARAPLLNGAPEVPADPAPVAVLPRARARPKAWGYSVAGLFLFTLVLLPPWNWPMAMPPAPRLGLTVTDEGERLRITWSPDRRVLGTARGGLLLIQEADHNTDAVMLDKPSPPDGAVLYKPRSPYVLVRLKIYRATAPPAEESVFCLASMARNTGTVFSAATPQQR